jgi:hypothetical protein
MEALQHESHRLYRYKTFCRLYRVDDFQKFVALYDVDELMSLLPTNPTQLQKFTLNELVGTKGLEGFTGYEKSNNTFELIQRWQEKIHTPRRAAAC